MDENRNQPEVQITPERVSENETAPAEKSSSLVGYILTAIIVVVVLVGVIYYMEQEGKLQTGIFVDSDGIAPKAIVATVNGDEIVGADLITSLNQITATAELQGIDTTDPNVQAEIYNQAVEMLVNTELLEQAAEERGVDISSEQVESRIQLLIEEVGSEELLSERMAALGIDDNILRRDVRSELMIQALLDQVFTEEGIDITEAEIVELYENTTGGAESAPTLEDIRPQLEAQIRALKEQQVVDSFISSLRDGADVTLTE